MITLVLVVIEIIITELVLVLLLLLAEFTEEFVAEVRYVILVILLGGLVIPYKALHDTA